jgi:peptide/nickel transport system substrate-binding protein
MFSVSFCRLAPSGPSAGNRIAIGQRIGRQGQKLAAPGGSPRRRWAASALLAAVVAVALAGAACRPGAGTPRGPAVKALVSSVRAEPRTFNRYAGRDSVLEIVTCLTQARLVRIDRRTQELQPWLARSWTASPDGLTYTLQLREGVRFSDGAPFTSADVLFAFRAIYDQRTGSALGDSMRVGGQPLAVSAPDASTVVVRFPSPFGPGLRLLDNLAILPRHKLERALDAGVLARAWDLSSPPSEMAGLGPFVLKTYQPGQRLVFERNPYYWRTDADGRRLPLLDRLTLEIVPDQDAEIVALESGQIDFTQSEMRPADYATLRRAAEQRKIVIADLGVGLDADSFWLNLRPGRPSVVRRPWLLRPELRRAISRAVDRKAFAETVFLGAAEPVYGPITPGNARWYAANLPRPGYDPAEARRLLASLGLRSRGGDAALVDRSGLPAGFTIITQKGNTALERGAAFIARELGTIGLKVDVAALDAGAAIDRIERGDYDAVYFRFLTTDVDPALNIDLWLSSGSAHVWNPSQPTPATDWEREIDELMTRQVTTLDQAQRKAIFDQVQRVLAEQLPMIQFAAPRVSLAMSRRVTGATPALLRPQILWNPDGLGVR